MGSEVTLDVGNLELDWGENDFFTNHSKLFLSGDRKKTPYRYEDGAAPQKDAFCRKLRDVKRRLELLGYDLSSAQRIYRSSRAYLPDYYPIDYHTFANVVGNTDLTGPHGLTMKEIFSGKKEVDDTGFELDPYVILRIVMENPGNREIELVWKYADLLEGGWISEDKIYEPLDNREKFLIVTEESTGSSVIEKSIELISPEISDFFTVIDMDEHYPFPGKGELYGFFKGLLAIHIENKVLIIYEDDGEGHRNYELSKNLDLPLNIDVMKLPDLEDFKGFTSEEYDVSKLEVLVASLYERCVSMSSAIKG